MNNHPFEKYVKQNYIAELKYAHNSINNPKYPKPKELKLSTPSRTSCIEFTIIGNYLTKDFIECTEMVNLFYRYKKNQFKTPIIKGRTRLYNLTLKQVDLETLLQELLIASKGVTPVEWPSLCRCLKIKFGSRAFCLIGQVAVIVDNELIGGKDALEEYLKQTYSYSLHIDYSTKAVQAFVERIILSGRPHVYMHIALDGTHIGTFIFMLYADLLPVTCSNFVRLCNLKKGGYSGTPVHRIVKDGWIQCGGFGIKSVDMACENYIVAHDRRGLLCMANDGRNHDNSTQFFVLLQPAEWMDHKYVAFGQLVDGEGALKTIEEVPTYYEAPTSVILIIDAGTLNLVPHDTKPNLGAREFVEGHVEDLNDLGDVIINHILDKVFEKIIDKTHGLKKEAPKLQHVEEELCVYGEEPIVHETKRFNKEDIRGQLERSNTADSEDVKSDIEEFFAEEYSYKNVSLASDVFVNRGKKPHYSALTDVMYPGEKESVFDFKRLVKGYYCLEGDLDQKLNVKDKTEDVKVDDIGTKTSIESLNQSLDSDDEKEIIEYLRRNADGVSFAGEIVTGITKAKRRVSLMEQRRKSEQLCSDHLARKFRRVSIKEPDAIPETKIRRRQLGSISYDTSDMERRSKETLSIAFAEERPAPRVQPSAPRRQPAFSSTIQSHVDPRATRSSVLSRLCDNTEFDHMDNGPTFKDYKPITSEKNNIFLTQTRMPYSNIFNENSKDKYGPVEAHTGDDTNQMLTCQDGMERKISADYVKTLAHSRLRHPKNSIRTAEYAKLRPSMSIQDYQQKYKQNQE